MNSALRTPDLSANLTITMLDGDLGAVTEPTAAGVLPSAEVLCWCGCVVCFSPSTSELPIGTDYDV